MKQYLLEKLEYYRKAVETAKQENRGTDICKEREARLTGYVRALEMAIWDNC